MSAPIRYVRTARQDGDSAQSKSGRIIPRHLNPQSGTYWTDALTTSWVAVLMEVTLAVRPSMPREAVDASAAFLSGMPLDRSIHIRAQ